MSSPRTAPAPDDNEAAPPTRRDRWFPPLAVGIALTLAGAYLLDAPPDEPFRIFVENNHIALIVLVAGFTTGLIAILAGPKQGGAARDAGARRTERLRRPRRAHPRLGWPLIVAGACCFVYLVYDTFKNPFGMDGPAAMFVGLLLHFAGSALLERRRPVWRDMRLTRGAGRGTGWLRSDGFWLVLVLAIWCGAQVQRLDRAPGYFNIDEGIVVDQGRLVYAPLAKETLRAPWANVFHPFLTCVPRAWAHDQFPRRPFLGSRLVGVAVGALALALVFFLARALGGRAAGWLALPLLGCNEIFLTMARSGLTNQDAIALVALWTLALAGAWRARRKSLGMLAGMLNGLAPYFYFSALAMGPIAIGLLLFQAAIFPRRVLRRWPVLLLYAMGFALTAAPNFIFFKVVKGDPYDPKWHMQTVLLTSRQNIELAFARTNAQSLPGLMADTAWPAMGGMMLWPHHGAPADYFDKTHPIFERGTAALGLLGLLAAAALARRRFLAGALALWFVCGGALPSWLTLDAPYAPRLVLALAAASILAGWIGSMAVARARGFGGKRLQAAAMLLAAGWTGTVCGNEARHYIKFANDPTVFWYQAMPWGFIEFLKTFPKDASLVYYARGGYVQMYNSVVEMFDTGFPRATFETPAPLPPPFAETRLTAYVFESPGFESVEQEFRRRYPDAKPKGLINPFAQNLPARFHVYWVNRKE